MKKFFALFTVAFFSIAVAFASSQEREFCKLVERYDASDEAKATEPGNPTLFWENLLYNNHLLMYDRIEMNYGGRAVDYALNEIKNIPTFDPWKEPSIITEMQGLCDTILIDMGIADLGINCSLHCCYSEEPNAFCILTPDGFAMILTSKLLLNQSLTNEMIMGYVAHEFAHGILKHHVRELYSQENERIKNKNMAIAAAVLYGVAAVANAYGSSMAGIPYDNSSYYSIISKLPSMAQLDTYRYCFKYSREQEIEADLMAFRFIDYIGHGDSFIKAIELLGSEYDDIYADNSTHPSINYRVAFLQYVNENPALYSEFNRKHMKEHASILNDPNFKWKVNI